MLILMIYLAMAALIAVNTIALLLVVLRLPGIWLMLAVTGLFAWWRWDDAILSGPVLICVAVLAVLSEILEFVAGTMGAKRAGGTARGALGALLGGILGGLLGTAVIAMPIIGSVIGACAGAGVGAWALELSGGGDHRASVASGVGAGVGTFTGTVIKFTIAVMIWLIVAVACFWP